MKRRSASVGAGLSGVLVIVLLGPACGSPDVVVARLPEPDAAPVPCRVAGADVDSGTAAPDDAGPEPCPMGQFCQAATCDAKNGTCAQIPSSCGSEFNPVCGCDGVNYFNDCLRLSARTQSTGAALCYGGSVPPVFCGVEDCPKPAMGASTCALVLGNGIVSPQFPQIAGAFSCFLTEVLPHLCWVLPEAPPPNPMPKQVHIINTSKCSANSMVASVGACTDAYTALQAGSDSVVAEDTSCEPDAGASR